MEAFSAQSTHFQANMASAYRKKDSTYANCLFCTEQCNGRGKSGRFWCFNFIPIDASDNDDIFEKMINLNVCDPCYDDFKLEFAEDGDRMAAEDVEYELNYVHRVND